jgi:hypothetical protein
MAKVIQLGGIKQFPGTDGVIRLGGGIKSGIGIRSPKVKTFEKIAGGVLTAQAGILGTLIGGPITGLKAAGLTGLGTGALISSPKIRKAAVTRIKDPTSAGRFIGKKVESIGKETIPKAVKTVKETVKGKSKVLSAAGLVAGGAGLAAVIPKAAKKVKEKLSSIPKSSITSALPVAKAPTEPFGAAEKVASPSQIEETKPAMPSIINKINVKPEINVSFKKSKKFINQQVFAR